ncbi:MAG: hypothetical protein K0S68_168 [Candidatus Saccharibacteria bacterium]|jgi:hypothetical protein|nr:hypothetical protein [Candidatus Saccharibacteria bacterium]
METSTTPVPIVQTDPDLGRYAIKFETSAVTHLYIADYVSLMHQLAAELGIEYQGPSPALLAAQLPQTFAAYLAKPGDYLISSLSTDKLFLMAQRMIGLTQPKDGRLYKVTEDLVVYFLHRLQSHGHQRESLALQVTKLYQLAHEHSPLTHVTQLLTTPKLRWQTSVTLMSDQQRLGLTTLFAGFIARQPLVQYPESDQHYPQIPELEVDTFTAKVVSEYLTPPTE